VQSSPVQDGECDMNDKLVFHGADTDTDTDTDSIQTRPSRLYILTSDTRDFLARKSVSVSVLHYTTPTRTPTPTSSRRSREDVRVGVGVGVGVVEFQLYEALVDLTLHYITLETIYSGLSKSNFKDHYGDAVI